MDLRKLLNDPKNAIAIRWGSSNDCPCTKEIHQLVTDIQSCKPRIKALNKDKQAISRAFADQTLLPSDRDNLKDQMRAISGKIKQLERQRKAGERQLLKLFESKGSPELPRRFLQTVNAIDSVSVRIDAISEDFGGCWNQYVNNHPKSTVYHLYDWRSLVKRCFGHDSLYLAAIDPAGNCRGILPIIFQNSRLFGARALSIPYFNYGGPLADSPAIARSLLEHAARQCDRRAIDSLEIRSMEVLNDWPRRDEKVSMFLALPADREQLDKQLGSKLRAQINQAESHHLITRFGSEDLLADFYSVFAQNMRDLGTPVYSRHFFEEILATFGKRVTLAVVYLGDLPVSGAFLIGYHDTLEIPWASTCRKFNRLNANMRLYRDVLGYAIEKGYAFFDFGRSTEGGNTYRFKKQWGAKPVAHHWHYWLRDGNALPEINPNNPRFRFIIATWQRLPVFLTNIIGPMVAKNLP